MKLARFVALLFALSCPGVVMAHELQPGFLELKEAAAGEYTVLWKQPTSLGSPLRLTPVFPADCQSLGEPRSEVLPQAWVWRVTIRCQQTLAGRMLAIEGLESFATDVLVRVEHADGHSETHLLKPDKPSIQLDATGTSRSALAYLMLGIEHIAFGFDHLMFVLGLLLIVANRWMLLKTITSFTLAHSITLGLATLGTIRLPTAPLEATIALSILFLAPEVVRTWRGQTSLTLRHPWLVAFVFGLLHGFAFASGLTTLGIPQDEIPLALLLFNAGVEIGQLAFVGVILVLHHVWVRMRWHTPRWLSMAPAYVLGSFGAFWTIQRALLIFGLKF
jgi:hypothetical protein